MMADIFNHLWQSTMFAAVVALLCFACRRNRARLRYGLWFAASAKFLVPFAALTAAGGLLEWRQAPAPVASVITSPVIRELNEPFAEISLGASALAVTSPDADWIVPSLFTLWLCGFAVIAVKRANGWRQIRAAIRVSAPWDATTTRLRQGYGGQAVPSDIEIRTAPTALEPGVVGLWKAVILLPAGIDTYLTERQLAAVIAHEVCHARRRDSLTAAVHMLVEALFWFHPMVWWIGARLVAEREQACDEHVVAETAEPVAYAEGIVTICRRYVETPLMSVAGVGGADVKARIDAILANRTGLRLTVSRCLLLAIAAVLSLAVPLVTGAIEAAAFAAGQGPGARAGGPPIDPQLRFEVASVKPVADASGPLGRFLPILPRFEYSQLPIGWLLRAALQKPDYQVIGAPGWVDSERYTIMAKAPDGTPQAALTTLMVNLLKDRFQLATHLETRELPTFNLVMARTDGQPGPNLKVTPADCQATVAEREAVAQAFAAGRGAPPPLPGMPGGPPLGDINAPPQCGFGRLLTGNVAVSGRSIAQFVTTLSEWMGRPVIDKTGLTGLYDFTLKFAPEGVRASGPLGPTLTLLQGQVQSPPADPNAPSLSAALEEQLGLKLESARGPVDVVVIDRLEKPTLD
jgi:bla regulator protein blaR1